MRKDKKKEYRFYKRGNFIYNHRNEKVGYVRETEKLESISFDEKDCKNEN